MGVSLDIRRAAKSQPLACTIQYNPKVAIVGFTEANICQTKGCRILQGRHRCAEAELVVIPDLTILHDLERLAADADLAISFLYIVSLGLNVVTQARLVTAKGIPRNLLPHHCTRHVPTYNQQKLFCLGPRLRLEQEDVCSALRRIARAPNSKFSLSQLCEPASGEIFLNSLHDVVAWAVSARRVDIELGPKVFETNGVAMLV